ncbi:uncharacterized protein LOC121999506 [Zingiber officinale]|uniref:uncharacterized protein LOC121999506 n=1 Tax=Zingiber officinale TaxID=94328 RepID=UPI001C4B57E8|nr:uncharacterized protein LOC121999506 [Zingiber officinale]
MSSRRYQKTSVNLFAIRQSSRETLRAYIQRFNQVAMDIPTVTLETMMNAFTQGLADGDFFCSLIRNPPHNYDHMLNKASEYINVEEAQAARRKEAPPEPPAIAKRRPPTSYQPPRGPRAEIARPHQGARSHVIQHVAANRPKQKGKVWTPMFCSLHQSTTHNTRDCRSLSPIAHPTPRSYRHRSPSPGRRHRHQSPGRRGARESPEQHLHRQPRVNPRASQERARPSAREEENRNNAARGEINIIAGGPTCGLCSQERASGPEISFGPRDLEGVEVPHDDALIIRAVIANYTIHRIFNDTAKPITGEPLRVYLSSTEHAVGSALVRLDGEE